MKLSLSSQSWITISSVTWIMAGTLNGGSAIEKGHRSGGPSRSLEVGPVRRCASLARYHPGAAPDVRFYFVPAPLSMKSLDMATSFLQQMMLRY
ncbi:hypothetical protein STA1M1_26950 [Sinisalibacter aestuarii]|uniref:Secreted protein n=1 Tax=Sinisalibacter aestuarii TaxID=2949426 RepID=A0ABQ5LX27_9RHOB|nr:hypothetical protein STA1M1_26950 [Sinisalibacter aestuarii]